MNRRLTVIAAVLWLAGLAAFIIGLNVKTDAGKWLTVAGQVAFLSGLGMEGVLYVQKHKNDSQKSPEKEKPETTDASDQKTPET